jgi:hypothetical protein
MSKKNNAAPVSYAVRYAAGQQRCVHLAGHHVTGQDGRQDSLFSGQSHVSSRPAALTAAFNVNWRAWLAVATSFATLAGTKDAPG